jgi:hypothetical protein
MGGNTRPSSSSNTHKGVFRPLAGLTVLALCGVVASTPAIVPLCMQGVHRSQCDTQVCTLLRQHTKKVAIIYGQRVQNGIYRQPGLTDAPEVVMILQPSMVGRAKCYYRTFSI